jgi:hypothetical protein
MCLNTLLYKFCNEAHLLEKAQNDRKLVTTQESESSIQKSVEKDQECVHFYHDAIDLQHVFFLFSPILTSDS